MSINWTKTETGYEEDNFIITRGKGRYYLFEKEIPRSSKQPVMRGTLTNCRIEAERIKASTFKVEIKESETPPQPLSVKIEVEFQGPEELAGTITETSCRPMTEEEIRVVQKELESGKGTTHTFKGVDGMGQPYEHQVVFSDEQFPLGPKSEGFAMPMTEEETQEVLAKNPNLTVVEIPIKGPPRPIGVISTNHVTKESTNIESWRKALREGLFPSFSTKALQAIRKGLTEDNPKLLQGATTSPPSLQCVQNWPCEAGCLTVYGYMMGDRNGTCTVGKAEEYFAKTMFEADQRLGEPAGCRYFLNWHDDTPRDEMRRLVGEEIDRELALRVETGV